MAPRNAGMTLRMAAAVLGLIFLAAFLGSFGAPSAAAPVAPLLEWILNPVAALMGLVGSIILFVFGVLLSAASKSTYRTQPESSEQPSSRDEV